MKVIKLIISSILGFICTNQSSGQNTWHPLNGGTDNGISCIVADTVNHVIYITGGFSLVDNNIPAFFAASWNGSQYNTLGCSNGFDMMSGANATGYIFNGQFIITKPFVYAYSYCQTPPVHVHKATYNGTEWDSLGGDWNNPTLYTFFSTYQGQLVAGGEMTSADSAAGSNCLINNITILGNDGYWKPLGTSGNVGVTYPSQPSCWVQDAIEFNSELFVSGIFDHAGGNALGSPGITRWNGTSWNDAGSSPLFRGVFGIYNSELYLGLTTGTVIYKWNGTSWITFAVTDTIPGATISDIAEWNGNLIVSGRFNTINGVLANNIAMWDGSQWLPLDNGLTVNGDPLYGFGASLTVLDGSLYVGGEFDMAGAISANNIARWGPTVGVSENVQETINIKPNPTSDYLTIENYKELYISYDIYNTYGKEIISSNANPINVGDLNNGIYILKLHGKNNMTYSSKFVVAQ